MGLFGKKEKPVKMTTQEVAKGLLEALTVKKQLKQVKKVIEGAIDPVLNFRFANGKENYTFFFKKKKYLLRKKKKKKNFG
jgi:hypothetical protein